MSLLHVVFLKVTESRNKAQLRRNLQEMTRKNIFHTHKDQKLSACQSNLRKPKKNAVLVGRKLDLYRNARTEYFLLMGVNQCVHE